MLTLMPGFHVIIQCIGEPLERSIQEFNGEEDSSGKKDDDPFDPGKPKKEAEEKHCAVPESKDLQIAFCAHRFPKTEVGMTGAAEHLLRHTFYACREGFLRY